MSETIIDKAEAGSAEMKYLKEITTLEVEKNVICVGAGYEEWDKPAYRWTFKEITHPKNFIPRAMDPANPKQEQDKKNCSGWSLSFFNTEDSAIKRLREICNDKNKLYKKLGTHIAEGMINKTDGKNGDLSSASGHFEHFEYAGTDFHRKFIVKTEVFKW